MSSLHEGPNRIALAFLRLASIRLMLRNDRAGGGNVHFWLAVLLALLCSPAFAEESKSERKAGIAELVKRMALTAKDRTAEAAFRSMFGPCGNPCVMPVDAHMLYWARAIAAATALKNEDATSGKTEKRVVIINVPCRGECALFADIVREQICLGPEAEFRFFRVAVADETLFTDPPFSKRVEDWILKKLRGKQIDGFVYPLVRDIKAAPTMTADEAVELGFWKACSSDLLAKANIAQ